MAQQRVITVPMPMVIKEEVLSDSEEIHCLLCHKAFASATALRNHARMDHTEAYEKGDPSFWTKLDINTVKTKTMQPYKLSNDPKSVQRRKQEILSSMKPTSLTSLASNNVSYIIIKSGSQLEAQVKQAVKDRDTKKTFAKKLKEIKEPRALIETGVSITNGPFECLEPSPLGADGACHQIFFSCCEYSAHARHEHARRRRSPRCQVCERVLPHHAASPAAPHVCESCGQGFARPEELEVHMATQHVKAKPYECNVCHKRFTQQGGVLQHMRRHTGDRPFPCTWCNKAFTQKSGLDQHLRTHTKQKPYRCVVCSKTFIQSVHLKQHMRTHTNVTPFQCGVCNKKFKQSSHLNYHLKNHNPSNMTQDQLQTYNIVTGQPQGEWQGVRYEVDGGRYEEEEQEEKEEQEREVQEENYQEDGEELEEEQDEDEVDLKEIEIEIPEMNDVEQVIAEPSILEDGDTYIISGSYDDMEQQYDS